MNKKSIIFFIIILIIFNGNYFLDIRTQEGIEQQHYSRIPEGVSEISMASIKHLFNGNSKQLMDLFDEQFISLPDSEVQTNSTIQQVREVDSPLDIKLIGYYSKFNINSEVYGVTYQLKFNNIWLIYTSIVSKIDDRYFLTKIDYRELSDSLWETNKFTLQNKGVLHYIILFFTIIIMLFTCVTSVTSFGSGNQIGIVWSILILFGIGSLRFNWFSGEVGINLLRIGIPSYIVERECTYMPIILTLHFPYLQYYIG
ncbi:MAG: hypothetical protein N4A63_08820 [Vallitalea sp.]|jgi:hypothetical protein|nr:hypothetical protein [Vallitalea sp.]